MTTKEKKVLSVEEHNGVIHAKVRELMQEIVKGKGELKDVRPVKQATLAQCNAMSKIDLKPTAPTIKLNHAQAVAPKASPSEI